MADKTLETLFRDMLKDIYYAERKIVRVLPKMAKAAKSPDLKAAFERHKEETEIQIERLQQVFELLGAPARGKNCPAIDGILEEGEESMQTFAGLPALDAALVAGAQAVEHYEMARYGTLRSWATLLGMTEAAELLAATLAEEEATDEALTMLADQSVNQSALDIAA